MPQAQKGVRSSLSTLHTTRCMQSNRIQPKRNSCYRNRKAKLMLLTVQEFAERLKVDSSTVRRWIRCGALTKFIMLPQRGRRTTYRIREEELIKILGDA